MKLINSDDIILPLSSEKVKTYLIPILQNKFFLDDYLQLADGWRYFEKLIVIQKFNNSFHKTIINFKEFLSKSSKHSYVSKLIAENFIGNLTSERVSSVDLNFSKCNLMSVLNFTPDSFNFNSIFNNSEKLKNKILNLKKNDIEIVDIGGESSRPGAKKISTKEEIKRLNFFFENVNLKKQKLKLSLDSRNYKTITNFINRGIDIINDISGLSDNRISDLLLNKNISVIIMHMQSEPENMQKNPTYDFPAIEIYDFFERKINFLLKNGIKRNQIIIDPGFGFGKYLEHNLNLFNYLPLFHSLGYPVCIGISRKSMIDHIYFSKTLKHLPVDNRLPGTITLQDIAFLCGVQIIRTHDVLETRQSLYCLQEVDI